MNGASNGVASGSQLSPMATVASPSADTVNSSGAAPLRRGPMLPRYSAMPSTAMASANRQYAARSASPHGPCR
ncbi:hypothetical protein G6F58_013769 [Rhizopus delemar]|nr:hypothetical protein G6F58_013769 [Rhizopus delemar]